MPTAEPVCEKCGHYLRVFGCDAKRCFSPGTPSPNPEDRPPPGYFKPWRWTGGVLKDGQGRTLIISASPHIEPNVRAVTERAAELEAKLRDMTLRAGALLESAYSDIGPIDKTDEDLVAIKECEAFLVELDKAKAGG